MPAFCIALLSSSLSCVASTGVGVWAASPSFAINLGADIFLADSAGRYLGRIYHYRECRPRVACHAQHCGLGNHLNDDLHLVTLSKDLLASPPIELWKVIRRLTVPEDLEEILLIKLERDQ